MTARGKGEFPSNGLPGKLHAAQNYAEDCGIAPDDLQVLLVARAAHERGEPVEEVWNEVVRG